MLSIVEAWFRWAGILILLTVSFSRTALFAQPCLDKMWFHFTTSNSLEGNIPTPLYLLVLPAERSTSLERKNNVSSISACLCVHEHMCVSVYRSETANPRMWKGHKTINALLRECSAGRHLTSGAAETRRWSALGWWADQCHMYHLSGTGPNASLDWHSGHIRHS